MSVKQTKPGDFLPAKTYLEVDEGVRHVFGNWKNLLYHIQPHHAALIELGGIAKIGSNILFHPENFWSAFQAVQAHIQQTEKVCCTDSVESQ